MILELDYLKCLLTMQGLQLKIACAITRLGRPMFIKKSTLFRNQFKSVPVKEIHFPAESCVLKSHFLSVEAGVSGGWAIKKTHQMFYKKPSMV